MKKLNSMVTAYTKEIIKHLTENGVEVEEIQEESFALLTQKDFIAEIAELVENKKIQYTDKFLKQISDLDDVEEITDMIADLIQEKIDVKVAA